jgi:hypothetical protein
MRHGQVEVGRSYDRIDVEDLARRAGLAPSLAVAEAPLAGPEEAMPDLPGAVGTMIAAVYAGLIGIFFATMARGGAATFAIVISGLYVCMFFGVPSLMLRVEKGRSKRPTLSRFMTDGIHTATGHMSGASALAQIFAVPLLLGVALLAMGIVARVLL